MVQQIFVLSPNRLPSLNRQKQEKLLIDRYLAFQTFQALNLRAKIRPTTASTAFLKQKQRFMNKSRKSPSPAVVPMRDNAIG
jgi:hypothetical protein